MSFTLPIPNRCTKQSAKHRSGERNLSHFRGVMTPTEELDESSVAQLQKLFELLDRWEREVSGLHGVTDGSETSDLARHSQQAQDTSNLTC